MDGMVLVATIAGWDYAIDWASYELPALRPFLEPPAVRLVRNGHILSRSLRREHINEAELMAKLREAGVKELSEVQAAYLESDGQISVLKRSARSSSRLDRSLDRAGAERRRARLRIEVIPQATLHRELWGSLMRGSSRGSAEVLQPLLTSLIVCIACSRATDRAVTGMPRNTQLPEPGENPRTIASSIASLRSENGPDVAIAPPLALT